MLMPDISFSECCISLLTCPFFKSTFLDTRSGLAIGLVAFLSVFVTCFAFGLVGMRRQKQIKMTPADEELLNEEADSAELVKGEDGSFPTFPQLAKITPSDDNLDLENPAQPIPTLTNTGSSELLSLGNANVACDTEDATVQAANQNGSDGIYSVPLPSPSRETTNGDMIANGEDPAAEVGQSEQSDGEDWAAVGATAAILAADDEASCTSSETMDFSPAGAPDKTSNSAPESADKRVSWNDQDDNYELI